MRKISWLVIGLLCLNVATPTNAAAQQQKEEAEDFVKDVLGGLLGPNWNIYLAGGVTTTGRFLLQRPLGSVTGEQALKSNAGYNFGIGGGGDYLLRQGYRLYYVYSKNDLNFRTNNGDGSSNLDVEPNASIHSNTIGLDLVRYMLPARATISPYGTLGIIGTWWGLDSSSPLVLSPGGSSQFRMGASLGFGVQVRSWEQFGARLEATNYTIGNPFTGKSSFRATGIVIDEPTTVGRWDYKLVGVYYFQKKSDVTIKKK